MSKKQYEQLIVWQEAHKLCLAVYQAATRFPAAEKHGLWSQVTRSAVSVPSNIVEGNVKRSKKEKLHYLSIAEGSLDELDYQIRLSRDIGYLTPDLHLELQESIYRVSSLLNKFRQGIIRSI